MHFFSCILIYLFVLSVINPATQRPSESSLTCLTPPASLGIATVHNFNLNFLIT